MSGRCPLELVIMIVQLADPRATVAFALSCHWLFREISNWSAFWKKQYCQEFPFDRDDNELGWLQQFVERRRSSISLSVTSGSKIDSRHRRRRVKRDETQIEVNWF